MWGFITENCFSNHLIFKQLEGHFPRGIIQLKKMFPYGSLTYETFAFFLFQNGVLGKIKTSFNKFCCHQKLLNYMHQEKKQND